MQKSLNKVELRGNVGFDPKINSYEEGGELMRLSLATNETYKNRKGEFVQETVWHNIVAWSGRSMPEFSKIKKGDLLEISGRIRPVQYVTKAGVERHTYEIVATSVRTEQTTIT
jgi:single-strand DNA-binding protein